MSCVWGAQEHPQFDNSLEGLTEFRVAVILMVTVYYF